MNVPFLSPKPISYSKKQGFLNNYKALSMVALGLIILFLAWLIIMRFLTDPLVKIDKYIEVKKLEKAAMLNYKLLQKNPEHRLALLMNGSIINFGIREMNISNTRLPFFEYDDFLAKEDKTGVFSRQAFLRKFSLFPDSVYFLEEFCKFSKSYPESIRNPETSVVIMRAFHSIVQWGKVNDECMTHVFHEVDSINSIISLVEADNLSVRLKPETRAKLMDRLHRKDRVLIKDQGMEESIGSKKAPWYFVLNERQIYGWVYGAYLQKQP